MQASRDGQELITEVWSVVSDYYLDARSSGFKQERWTALRDKYLSEPLPTRAAAYRCTSNRVTSWSSRLLPFTPLALMLATSVIADSCIGEDISMIHIAS